MREAAQGNAVVRAGRLAGLLAWPLAWLLAAAPAAGQADSPPRLQAGVHAGASVREGGRTLRFGDDLVTWGFRVGWSATPLWPWLQVDGFERPELQCLSALPCNDRGWILRAGVTLPIAIRPHDPGPSPYLTVGVGRGFSESSRTSYMVGLGYAWVFGAGLAPHVELRLEGLPSLGMVTTVNGGIRVSFL